MVHSLLLSVGIGVAIFGLLRLLAQSRQDPNESRDMAEVQRLAATGQLIRAIKLHRELTGMGLKESKDAVEAMFRGAVTSSVPPAFSTGPNPEADARILALLRQNKYIEAVKIHRETYGVGLKESKDAIDRLKAGL
jgi:large subunit ribosomal protein L7/L12